MKPSYTVLVEFWGIRRGQTSSTSMTDDHTMHSTSSWHWSWGRILYASALQVLCCKYMVTNSAFAGLIREYITCLMTVMDWEHGKCTWESCFYSCCVISSKKITHQGAPLCPMTNIGGCILFSPWCIQYTHPRCVEDEIQVSIGAVNQYHEIYFIVYFTVTEIWAHL